MANLKSLSMNLFALSKPLLNFQMLNKHKLCLVSYSSLCKLNRPKPRIYTNNKIIAFDSFSCKYELSVGQRILCSTKSNPEPETNAESVSEPSRVEEELTKKLEIASKEAEDYKDKYQRTLADRENLRQRLEKQITDSRLFGIQNFCKDLLEVSDVFQKAIESVPESKVKEADAVFINLYEGVIMTENQLLGVFRRHGLQRIIPKEGDKFDPSEQEALFEAPLTEGKTPGTVGHVVRTGWKLHDRCVRSAQVSVVKG